MPRPIERESGWRREKAGTIEHVHRSTKEELAAGVLPSRRFGANAAWFRINAGNISGGSADINRFRFELDCDPDNQLFIGCSNTRNSPPEVNYDGDIHISPSTTCVNRFGNQLVVFSNVPAGGSAINQIVFTFVDVGSKVPTPLHLVDFDSTGCTVTFQVTVLAHDDNLSPGTVDRIEHVLGFDESQRDAVCSTGGVSHSADSKFILLCPACDVHGLCAGPR